MKKYMTLLLTVLSFAGLAWAGMLAMRIALAPAVPVSLAQAVNLPAQDRAAALHHLHRLDAVLQQIDRLGLLAPQAAVGPIAQVPASAPLAQGGLPRATLKSRPAMALPVFSMVYLSSDMQRVVVNGSLYEVGDLLPGGGRLAEIGMNQVVIKFGHRRQVVILPKNQVLGSTRKL